MTAASITPEQRSALAKLAPLLPDEFYLVGGVALAAHLHHRVSRDLDFFSSESPEPLQAKLEQLAGVVIESRGPGTIHLRLDGVPISLIEYRYPLIAPVAALAELPVPVASIDDLACMKLSAIAGRGAARDFWDLHTIVTRVGVPLAALLASFRRKYPVEDLGHVLRSLVYFGEATGPLPLGLTQAHWDEIQVDLERWVQELVAGSRT